MKKFVVLAAILMVCLFMGCGDSDDNDNNDTGQYTGFPEMSGGEWSKYNISGQGRMKYEYLGTDTWDNQECYVIEFDMEVEGEKAISQIWINQKNNQSVLYVMKQAGMVIKMDISTLSESSTDIAEGASGTTPDEYSPGNETSFETYVTPTGREVKSAVFKEDSDEYWVSEEVPFGLVLNVIDGQRMIELYDFAFSGAERDISKEEIENATDFGNFPDFQ